MDLSALIGISKVKSMQNGESTLTTGGSSKTGNITVSSVNPDKCVPFVTQNGSGVFVKAKVTSATNLQISRSVTSSVDIDVDWVLLELDF